MKKVKVKCPAKINLTLEIVNKRDDGFHNIKSIMQMIDLYDTLEVCVSENSTMQIVLSGNSNEIPYDERNLVYKAADLFFKETGIGNRKVEIYIDKKIPIAAGLAGGSTDAAGTFFALNEIFEKPLSKVELHRLCAELGSDLNVCLEGGCILATSRGEKIAKLKSAFYPVTVIKPKNLGISAKEAYTKYSHKKEKPHYNMTEKMIEKLEAGGDISKYLYNDLEYAVFDDYSELQKIKSAYKNSIMSGSGSAYFILANEKDDLLDEKEYKIFHDLHFINKGVSLCSF